MLTRQLRLCDCWPRSIERLVSSQWLGTKLQSTCCLSHANFFFKSTLAGKDVKKDPAFIKNGTVSVVVACWFCISNRQRSPEYRKVARVIFKATNPLCLEKYADAPQLGRFTLRDEGIVLFVRYAGARFVVDLNRGCFSTRQRQNDCDWKGHRDRETGLKRRIKQRRIVIRISSMHML